MERLGKILDFVILIGKLKKVRRFKTNGKCQGDSTAEHCWRLALLAALLVEELNRYKSMALDLVKVVKLVLIHDLAEIETDDIDAVLVSNGYYSAEKKDQQEQEAMHKLCCELPEDLTAEILALYQEYHSPTPEGCCARALDKIETILTLCVQGPQSFDDPCFLAKYGNKEVAKFPPLREFFSLVKKRLRGEFVKAGFEWRQEYEVY